ncbi:MAG: FAD-dependent oxidoreductase [bacterium]|nr:FAD-dependent oxidoreductase [bacterium]
MKYVIIGSSAAGMAAVKAIRAQDAQGSLTLVTQDATFYSRCQLHYVASGHKTAAQITLAKPDWHQHYQVAFHGHTTVTALDAAARTVTLDTGAVLPYDRLLIASGARSVFPPIAGLAGCNSFSLRTIEDAHAINHAVHATETVVIIGAGLVGVELALELAAIGKKVFLVELATRPLPLQLETIAGDLCAAMLRAAGIEVVLNQSVTAVQRDAAGQPTAVTLKSGAQIATRVVVCAAGTRPNVDFAAQTGLKINKGVVINLRCETSLPEVYAAGDVAEIPDTLTGKYAMSSIWPSAVRHGTVAGTRMAGGTAELDYNTSLKTAVSIAGTHVVSIGMVTSPDPAWHKHVLRGTNSRGQASLRILYVYQQRLMAALLWGDVVNAGVYSKAIVTQCDISQDDAFLGDLDAAKFGLDRAANATAGNANIQYPIPPLTGLQAARNFQ